MYKVKHIIAQNPNKLKGNRVIFSVEGTVYSFKIDEIRTTIMELTEYFPHEDIRNRIGPIEEELMGITYGKSKSQMEAWQYAKSFTDFKVNVDGNPFKFEVKGVGPSAVKLNLYITFKEIDEAKSNLCKELKSKILESYEDEISRNKSKLDELKRKDDELEAERIRNQEAERKRQEKLKERFKDIEHLL
ncbi:MAG: DUF4337 domain-containing protein [Methanobrevibacter thaueri]|jgi:hypothetical protein|uniref:coiled-coil domain-containing protein n=1 Tax=Methanobrevibacter thaueri TaxID=190975 RepID=UPI0026F2F0BD|nr:hypothetical protein [Methanobrevibacter thaueri]MBE6496660.1 DUF4337 domain-containing protein [Methanobrevibacter thaueri]